MATIQTTQLEERETGDIKQLRDHDIAEGPVSTNSADATSLKSVPLTLEDGSIIKVRFDSLVTAIGQALGASEDSTVTKVLGLNGTVPKGINMANLASVLGGDRLFERILFREPVNIGSSIAVSAYFTGVYIFIDADCACAYLVFKAGPWVTVVGNLENTVANGYAFTIVNDYLTANHNLEGCSIKGALTCWRILG